MTTITLPTSSKTLSTSAFRRCSGLSSFTIPSSVTSISGNVFEGCAKLSPISVSSTNTPYSSLDGMLYNKSRTALITIPEYKSGAVVLPSTLATIRDYSTGSYAFRSCRSLTRVRLPSHLTVIGDWFGSCESLTEINFPEGLLRIEDDAFSNAKVLSDVVIPETVEHIGLRAFFITGLREIRIPAAVQSIGNIAFSGCPDLTEIHVDPANPNYASFDGGSISLRYSAGRTDIT